MFTSIFEPTISIFEQNLYSLQFFLQFEARRSIPKKQLFSLEVAMNEISIEFGLFLFPESERFRSKKSQSVRLSHVKRQILRRPGLKAELKVIIRHFVSIKYLPKNVL